MPITSVDGYSFLECTQMQIAKKIQMRLRVPCGCPICAARHGDSFPTVASSGKNACLPASSPRNSATCGPAWSSTSCNFLVSDYG
jgi:hypothetical protein